MLPLKLPIWFENGVVQAQHRRGHLSGLWILSNSHKRVGIRRPYSFIGYRSLDQNASYLNFEHVTAARIPKWLHYWPILLAFSFNFVFPLHLYLSFKLRVVPPTHHLILVLILTPVPLWYAPTWPRPLVKQPWEAHSLFHLILHSAHSLLLPSVLILFSLDMVSIFPTLTSLSVSTNLSPLQLELHLATS